MRRYLPGLALALLLACLPCRSLAQVPAGAGPTVFPVLDQAVVRILIAHGDVTVRTWDRNAVQIESVDDVDTRKTAVRFANTPEAGAQPLTMQMISGTVQSRDGPVSLPAEDFVVSTVTPGIHDAVVVNGRQLTGPLTVTVPSTVGLVAVGVGAGKLTITGLHSGTFVAQVRGGSATFDGVVADGFVQVLNGPIVALDSTFNRIRARTALRNMFFERCRVRQIEATSVEGSIFFDDGAFDPGLARFETDQGNVAIGVSNGSGARIGALTAGGRVYAAFNGRGVLDQPRPGEASAVIAAGGPLVNVKTGAGSIYLYDGPLAGKRVLPPEWAAVRGPLRYRLDHLEGDVPNAPGPNTVPAFRRQLRELRDRPA